MLLVGKVALGCLGTLVLAGAYTFHEGILQVDEDHGDGRHVHVWLPAAVVPIAMQVVPRRYFAHAAHNAGPWLPTVRVFAKELAKYPETDLVDVDGDDQHVHIRTHHRTLLIDVESPGENVHVSCPLATIEHIADELAAAGPAA